MPLGDRFPSPTPRPLGDVLAYAALCALVASALEPLGAFTGASLASVSHQMMGEYLLWMPAAANIVEFVLIGGIAWGLMRLIRHRAAWLVSAWFLATLAAMSFLRFMDDRLGVTTVNLLAAGIGVQFVQRALPRVESVLPRLRRAAAVALVLLSGTAIGIETLRANRERHLIASLPTPRAGAPNILLLVLDTVRAMSLSAYGYGRPTSPTLDSLASRGVLFEHAISTAPWTRPGHAGLFTGAWPHQHTAHHDEPLGSGGTTLAEALARRGYVTAGFTANLAQTARPSGLARGFHHYDDFRITPAQVMISASEPRRLYRWLQRHFAFPETRLSYQRKSAMEVNQALLEWVDAHHNAPFFAFANYMEAHAPYRARAPFDTAFSDPAYASPLPAMGDGRAGNPARNLRPYDQAIATLDHEIGLLLDQLRQRGRLRNTIVVITSDHGEAFGEQGVYGHGSTLYMPMLQVPLIIAWADGLQESYREQAWVSTRDLPTTLLQLVAPSEATEFPGQSLLTRSTTNQRHPDTLFAASRFAANNPLWYPVAKGDLEGILLQELMLIREADGRRELYDLRSDPAMGQNLWAGADQQRAGQTLDQILERAVGPARLHPSYLARRTE